MVKKASLSIGLILLIISTGVCKVKMTFKGLGGGGQGMVVYQDNDFPRDGLTGGIGLRGIVEFQFGTFGLLQYIPNLTFWFSRYDALRDTVSGMKVQYDHREMQVAINLFDIKYMFNTSNSNFNPYAGISVLPSILINKHHDKYELQNSDGSNVVRDHDDPQTKPSIGFNVFGGADFPIKDRVIPFIEARFTATKEWAIKGIVGMCLWF